MTIRIVNNQKLEMSDQEYELYQKIVKSYTNQTNRGSDLFLDLYDTDDRGIITLLRPPSQRRTSLEIFLFLMSLMQNQHMRLMYDEVGNICGQMKNKMNEIEEKLSKLEKSNDK